MKNKSSAKGIIVLSILLAVLIFIPLKGYTSKLAYEVNHYLPNNLYINNINLGGKTLEQAMEILGRLEKAQLNKLIVISYEGEENYRQSSTYSYEQLGFYADKKAILSQLNGIMDKDINFMKRLIRYKRIENSREDYTMPYLINYDKYMNTLQAFDNATLKPPKDAAYVCSNGMVEIIPEENGTVFDKDRLYKELLADKNLKTAKLHVKPVKATITAQNLEAQGVKELVSSFTTKFDAGNAPRSSNIRLAATLIDGALVPPGGTFSFNEIVGERTEKRGFLEAGVYINGKVDTGIGGGICQVSTTLYNAVLLADYPVLERSNHSLTVPYVPLSRDAAVSWGAQDFKFSNNTSNYILVHCRTSKNTITFELYSTKVNKTVELISTTLSRTKAPVQYIDDMTQLIGKEEVIEKGHDGYQSQLIKNVFLDGKQISSELVSKDRYIPAFKVIKRGIKLPDVLSDIYSEY